MKQVPGIFVFFLLQFLVAQLAMGQWRAVYYEDVFYDKAYSVRTSPGVKLTKGFYFPEYHFDDSVLVDGLVVNHKTGLKSKSVLETLAIKTKTNWYQNLETPVACTPDTTVIYQRVWTRNVARYTLLLRSAAGKWFAKDFSIDEGGYQIPTTLPVSEWKPYADRTGPPQPGNAGFTGQIHGIMLLVEPGDEHVAAQLVVGDLCIGKQASREVEASHPFLDRLFGRNTDYRTDSPLRGMSRAVPLLINSERFTKGNIRGCNYFVSKTPQGEVELFKKLTRLSVELYPFYQEKKLDKDNISSKLESLLTRYPDSCSITGLARAVANFVHQEFRDPHYYVSIPGKGSKPKGYGPVRLYELDGGIHVAAVFDSAYAGLLGSKILAIDGVAAGKLADSLAGHELGSPERRRRSAVSKLLLKPANDSTLLTVERVKTGEVQDVKLFYNRKVSIPANFSGKHCAFKLTSDSIACFSLHRWSQGEYLSLLNHWDEVKKAKGLIFDLRNNGGGDIYSTIQILSLFISQPTVFGHSFSSTDRSTIESLVVAPNAAFNLPANVPVGIITNEYTGCASEQFIMSMSKARKNCVVVGSGRTSGNLSSMHEFVFPSGISLRTNSVFYKDYFPNGSIEDTGLQPDVYIKLTAVEDLAPYQDKILRATQKIVAAGR